MEIKEVVIGQLKPYSKNTKAHPKEQIEKIKKSIEEFGFNAPILLTEDLEIVAGHGRVLAADELGYKTLPAVFLKDLTHNQIKAYRIADNKTAESEWLEDLLKTEFIDLAEEDYDLELTGFSGDEIDTILKKDLDPSDLQDPEPDNPGEVKTDIKEGDIYQLGDHRLMCGDCKNGEFVIKLTKGENLDLLLTDPPYGISIVNKESVGVSNTLGFVGLPKKTKSMLVNSQKYREIQGDTNPFDPSFLLKYCSKKIIFGGNHFASKLPDNSVWLVWDKKIEGGLDHNNFSDVELMWTNIKGKAAKIYRHLWSGLLRKGNRKEELTKRVHPTQKPVGLLKDIIDDYSKEQELILDLFGGSGSTLIACEQLNRKCYMMEIDPKYCQVIINRWEKLTGNKAVKVNGS